jgi:hypothetical protein
MRTEMSTERRVTRIRSWLTLEYQGSGQGEGRWQGCKNRGYQQHQGKGKGLVEANVHVHGVAQGSEMQLRISPNHALNDLEDDTLQVAGRLRRSCKFGSLAKEGAGSSGSHPACGFAALDGGTCARMNREKKVVLATWVIRSGIRHFENDIPFLYIACKRRKARVKLGVVNSFSCSHDNLRGRRNVFYESCSYTYPTVEGFQLGCASPSLCSLDQTAYFLIAARVARRSEQKQVPTQSGKRSLTPATHHSQSTGETTRLSQGGSITSRLAGQGGPHMETGPFYCSTRHTSAASIVSSFAWSGSAGLRSLRVRRR